MDGLIPPVFGFGFIYFLMDPALEYCSKSLPGGHLSQVS